LGDAEAPHHPVSVGRRLGSTSAWTLQQLRESIGPQERYEYLLHDRDSIFAQHLDESIVRLGVKVVKSPPQSPTANSICERVIGTIRQQCLDWLISLTESHLRSILKLWVAHYNTGRPHMALGPGVPDPPRGMQHSAAPKSLHRLREDRVVRAHSILGGPHHEYFWAPAGAH
jgi:transposase InsO family protein